MSTVEEHDAEQAAITYLCETGQCDHPECLREYDEKRMDELEHQSLDNRELATVLAALRWWQRTDSDHTPDENMIASDMDTLTPLSNDEIDDLCERLNA